MSLNEINIDELIKMLDELKPPERERRIKMYAGNLLIGHAVDFTYTRERAPVYIMGNPDPRTFTRERHRRIIGEVIGLRATPEGEDYLHKYLRSTQYITFEIESHRPDYPDMTVEVLDFTIGDFNISRTRNEWKLHWRADVMKQYEIPKNNKQAAKLLLKR